VHPSDTEETKTFKEGKACYEVANKGDPFEGYRIPLGALVYYKPPKHRELPAFDPKNCSRNILWLAFRSRCQVQRCSLCLGL